MTRVLPALRERYDLTLLDKRNTNPDGKEVEGVILTDLLDRNRDQYREHFKGADAVIHSGFVRAKEGEERYWAEMENVNMSYNVYQTCVEEDVRRLVVISSNHAGDYYERLIWADKMLAVTPEKRRFRFGATTRTSRIGLPTSPGRSVSGASLTGTFALRRGMRAG